MGLTKGHRFTNLRSFVEERFGARAWDELLRAMSAADAAVLRGVIPGGWYEDVLQARLVRALCGRFGGAALANDLGRFESQRDLTTCQRWFLRLVRPSFAVRNMNIYWCRFHDSGRWTSEVVGTQVIAQLSGWNLVERDLCQFLQGYLGRTLELLGSAESIVLHPRCRADGAEVCEFRTHRFHAPDWATRSKSPIKVEELPQIQHELTQIADPDALADAVMKLCKERLSFPFVALWAQSELAGELRLLRSVGVRAGLEPRQFVLQAAGDTVGQLDVGISPLSDSLGVLEQLLPCLSASLHASLSCSRTPDAAAIAEGAASGAAFRVDAASKEWNLTPKQREVLKLMVHGKTNKEIASALDCQEGTVEVHMTQLFRKSGAVNRTSLSAAVAGWGVKGEDVRRGVRI